MSIIESVHDLLDLPGLVATRGALTTLGSGGLIIASPIMQNDPKRTAYLRQMWLRTELLDGLGNDLTALRDAALIHLVHELELSVSELSHLKINGVLPREPAGLRSGSARSNARIRLPDEATAALRIWISQALLTDGRVLRGLRPREARPDQIRRAYVMRHGLRLPRPESEILSVMTPSELIETYVSIGQLTNLRSDPQIAA